TDRNQKTTVEGLYAAGDVCVKNLRQVVTAVGDGALAATELEKFAAAMQRKTGLQPVLPAANAAKPAIEPKAPGRDSAKEEGFFSGEIIAQLQAVFEKMEQPLVLRLYLDSRPVSEELEQYMRALAALTNRLSVEIGDRQKAAEGYPCVRMVRGDGTDTGLAFHGVPGGHEFTSFVLGMYNAAGPGQALEPEVERGILSIPGPVHMQVLVSLSCTMCPELVTAAQRIAAAHPDATAEVFDLNHFPEFKDRYQVMSVPCLVIGGMQVSFGKKNIRQLLDLLVKK
ncbi:MAG: thioredoxin family protein, partial [Oscillospiraceae bacterium]